MREQEVERLRVSRNERNGAVEGTRDRELPEMRGIYLVFMRLTGTRLCSRQYETRGCFEF
jgi:hypothetical protein